MEIGEQVYDIVSRWDYFNKDTLGKQFIRNTDSIALNIAEGFGRYYFKENKLFCFYSRGSAYESTCCLKKDVQRNLVSSEENIRLRAKFGKYFGLMAGYIKSIGTTKTEME